LGLPIPEELPIAIAAMMARWQLMNWAGALFSCVAGVLAGDMLLYWVGRHFGRQILKWSTVRRILTPAREARVMDAYHRHGLEFVVMARPRVGRRAAAGAGRRVPDRGAGARAVSPLLPGRRRGGADQRAAVVRGGLPRRGFRRGGADVGARAAILDRRRRAADRGGLDHRPRAAPPARLAAVGAAVAVVSWGHRGRLTAHALSAPARGGRLRWRGRVPIPSQARDSLVLVPHVAGPARRAGGRLAGR